MFPLRFSLQTYKKLFQKPFCLQNDLTQLIFKTNLTEEQQTKVLNTLNQASHEELTKINISQARIRKIHDYRLKHGQFNSLNNVLEVDGFGEKVLEKICETILSENYSNQILRPPKKQKPVVTPIPQQKTIDDIASVLGLHLGPTGISWAKLAKHHNELVNWDQFVFTDLPPKLTATETFTLALKIMDNLPTADLYVFEQPGKSTGGSTNSGNLTQQLELSSMLLALINTSQRHNSYGANRVYYLKTNVPARLFGTLVGNERVSAATRILQLINTTEEIFSLPCSKITLQEQIKIFFHGQSPANKELLGQALLLVVSFMDLCVYKTSSSLEAISPNRRKNPIL